MATTRGLPSRVYVRRDRDANSGVESLTVGETVTDFAEHDAVGVYELVDANDAREAHALFERMPTRDLLHLRSAHKHDQAHAAQPETIAFSAGRMALIDDVLSNREHVHAFVEWATFHRAPAGPYPAHTSFIVLTCAGCQALRIFPPDNFALCTDAFKAQFVDAAAAAGWRYDEEPGSVATPFGATGVTTSRGHPISEKGVSGQEAD